MSDSAIMSCSTASVFIVFIIMTFAFAFAFAFVFAFTLSEKFTELGRFLIWVYIHKDIEFLAAKLHSRAMAAGIFESLDNMSKDTFPPVLSRTRRSVINEVLIAPEIH